MSFRKCRDSGINKWPGLSRGAGKSMIINPNLPQIWTPKLLTPALWYSANGASNFTLLAANKISQWLDISGNARHLNQATGGNQPTYNAIGFNSVMPCVQMASGNFMVGPSFTTSASNPFPNAAFIAAVIQKTGTNNTNEAAPIQLYNGGNPCPISYSNVTMGVGTGAAATNFTVSDVRLMTSGTILEYGASNAPAEVQFLNGNQILNATTAANYLSLYRTVTVGLAYNSGGSLRFTGNLMEILAFPAIPSALNRQKIEGYLAWGWNLTANLSAGHPYKNTPPLI